jgi:hypothetical protein
MPEIGTSGSMSGDGKRSVAAWPKLPRPSSTLPKADIDRHEFGHVRGIAIGGYTGVARVDFSSDEGKYSFRHPAIRASVTASAASPSSK